MNLNFPRKSLLSLTLVVALFGAPALGSGHVPGSPGGVSHLPAIQLATLPRRVRLRRRVRGSKMREIAWRVGRRVRAAGAAIGAGNESVKPRLPPHDSYARGPPRASRR